MIIIIIIIINFLIKASNKVVDKCKDIAFSNFINQNESEENDEYIEKSNDSHENESENASNNNNLKTSLNKRKKSVLFNKFPSSQRNLLYKMKTIKEQESEIDEPKP